MDDENGNAYIRFYQDTYFRRCEILCLDVRQLSDELVSEHVTYRINSLA